MPQHIPKTSKTLRTRPKSLPTADKPSTARQESTKVLRKLKKAK